MLNIYFVFGVPAFLLILYLIFAYIRKKTTIRYLGFILLIIASFMLVFNLQTWQQALLEMEQALSIFIRSIRLSDLLDLDSHYCCWFSRLIKPFSCLAPAKTVKKKNRIKTCILL